MGVRVLRVWDEGHVQAGRRARVFGFEYATLRGRRCCERMARLTQEKLGLSIDSRPATVRFDEADAPNTVVLSEPILLRRARRPS